MKLFNRNKTAQEESTPQVDAVPQAEAASQEEPVAAPAEKVPVFKKILCLFKTIGIILYRLRKIFMAIPVLYVAFRLAFYNMANLPAQVGLSLQVNGEFGQMISRELAVYGPLGVTGACLLIMFLSRRCLHPWVISIFSLVLPLLVYFVNFFPQ